MMRDQFLFVWMPALLMAAVLAVLLPDTSDSVVRVVTQLVYRW